MSAFQIVALIVLIVSASLLALSYIAPFISKRKSETTTTRKIKPRKTAKQRTSKNEDDLQVLIDATNELNRRISGVNKKLEHILKDLTNL